MEVEGGEINTPCCDLPKTNEAAVAVLPTLERWGGRCRSMTDDVEDSLQMGPIISILRRLKLS
jgi:hypothetical protein